MCLRFPLPALSLRITCFCALCWSITGCTKEKLSDCPPSGRYAVVFEYVNHTDALEPDRFTTDVRQIDLYAFDASDRFVKTIVRTGDPFPEDFRIEPELPAGDYTLVAWGNRTDEMVQSPDFTAGKTTLQEAMLTLARDQEQCIRHQLTPLFHASKRVTVDYSADRTDILPMTRNTKRLNLRIQWFDDEQPCAHGCAEGVRARILDPDGGILKFDNSVVASGTELTYYSHRHATNQDANSLEETFSLLRLTEEKTLTLVVERVNPDGTAEELYRADLVKDLILKHPNSRSQADLDKQDTYDVELRFDDTTPDGNDTYMQTAITVAGWTIILQDAGI